MASTLRKHWQLVKKEQPNIEREKGIKQDLGPKLDATAKLVANFQKADAEMLKRWRLVMEGWADCQAAWQEYERRIPSNTPIKEFGRQMGLNDQQLRHVAKSLADYQQATNGLVRAWQ